MGYVFSTPLPTTSHDVRQKSLDYSLFTWSPQKNLKTIEVKGAKDAITGIMMEKSILIYVHSLFA